MSARAHSRTHPDGLHSGEEEGERESRAGTAARALSALPRAREDAPSAENERGGDGEGEGHADASARASASVEVGACGLGARVRGPG